MCNSEQRTPEGRKIVNNKDGTISTERTITVGFGEKDNPFYLNIPTMDKKGKQLSEDEAIEAVVKAGYKDPVTGKKLKRFNNLSEAESFAIHRSEGLGLELRGR